MSNQEAMLLQEQVTRIDERVALLSKNVQVQAELATNLSELRLSVLSMTGQVEEFNERARMLSERMDTMERSLAEMSQVYRSQVLERSAATNLKLTRLKSEMRTLSLETAAFIKLIEKKNGISTRTHRNTVASIAKELAATAAKGSQMAGAAQPGKPLSEQAPDEIYQTSYRLFLDKRYNEAIKGFTTYIDQFPKTTLSDNSAYWIGESYYYMKNFQQAAITFDSMAQRYPNSIKAPAALLRSAFSYLELGDPENAVIRLQIIIDKYPTSNEAVQASDRLPLLINEGDFPTAEPDGEPKDNTFKDQ